MDAMRIEDNAEEMLYEKATLMREPIGATFELSPLCNMDCRMCYVRMTSEELKTKGRLRSVDEWLSYAAQAKEYGLFFLLLTGGEPFLYPGFRRLYQSLRDMGLIVSINTNGTLIDEETIRWLAAVPPRRLNITLYGAKDETYARLCGNPNGFTRVMHALDLCKENGIEVKLNYTVTKDNIGDLKSVLRIAKERNLKLTVVYYVFPANRRDYDNGDTRLSPALAAEVRLMSEVNELGIEGFMTKCNFLLKLEDGEVDIPKPEHDTAFTCRSGLSTYWVNWQGKMLLCGMTDAIQFDLDQYGFEKCWSLLQEAVSKTRCSEKCASCKHETVCTRCAAAALAETGHYEGTPTYLCELYDAYLKRIRGIAERAGIRSK